MKSNYQITDEELNAILEIARFAPSVHNAQSWKVMTKGASLVASLDPKHTVVAGDPTGRETVISLGIFVEALVIAARAVGFSVETIIYGDRIATITLNKDQKVQQDASDSVRLLKQRHTDRSIYTPARAEQLRALKLDGLSTHSSVTIRTTTDQAIIKTVAELTSKAISLALSNPAFKKELGQYLVGPLSRRQRGIATKSLCISPFIASLQPPLMKLGIGGRHEGLLEQKRWLSASELVIITAKGDMPNYWFEVGRTYLRASIAIEAAGLRQATSAGIVEASNFHDDIEAMLGTSERILALIRVGNGHADRHYSPRVSAQELLATSPSQSV